MDVRSKSAHRLIRIPEDIAYLRGNSLSDDDFLFESATKGSRAHRAIENVLKGVEIGLPDGVSFTTYDGIERFSLRVRWWKKLDGRPSREIGFPERVEYPLLSAAIDESMKLSG